MQNKQILLTLAVVMLAFTRLEPACGSQADEALQAALERAGDNRPRLQAALDQIEEAQRPGMEFLIAHMPDRDLKTLSTQFLLDNVRLAYQAWNVCPWKDQIPEHVFFNNVLPYASINERRDAWRKDFHERFAPLIREATSPGQAAAILNQKIFPLLEVRYSTQRNRADQGPYESIESGLASCTGLSILLVDACRAVGVPARFVGTPLWTNKSGNHSWVEVWDNGWHFTGAAEPTGEKLDQAWFTGRAATAVRDHPLHAIYAVSYKRTPQRFPMVWDRQADYVFAVNVTDRYTRLARPIPAGHVEVMLRVVATGGERLSVPVFLTDSQGQVVFDGISNDERFDTNDHLIALLKQGETYDVQLGKEEPLIKQQIVAERRDQPYTFQWNLPLPEATSDAASDDDCGTCAAAAARPCPQTATNTQRQQVSPRDSQHARSLIVLAFAPSLDFVTKPETTVVQELREYLSLEPAERPPLDQATFGDRPLSADQATEVARLLWQDRAGRLRELRAAEMEAGQISDGDLTMPFTYKVFGDKPAEGRSLFISMHGGGGAPAEVNDRQWENQKRLYSLQEGVYLVPRAPTNTWNMWHQGHIDRMFDRLIENLVLLEDVNPNRVYLMGYSAGGDGVFQLAPRMADRFAAAAMMAGHPNETSPLGLRNLPFTLHMGGKDSAYRRNAVAESWKQQLAELQKNDPDGYPHLVKIYPEKGHWMDREDAAAIPWMQQYHRNPHPNRVVWKQDDVTHQRFYWLAMPHDQIPGRAEISAEIDAQHINIRSTDVQQVAIRLNDQMLDLDKPVSVTVNGQPVFEGLLARRIAVIDKTLNERGDRSGIYSAELLVEFPDKSDSQ